MLLGESLCEYILSWLLFLFEFSQHDRWIKKKLLLFFISSLDSMELDSRFVSHQVFTMMLYSIWNFLENMFSDWDIYRYCSPDAYYYLLFHSYLIFYLLFVTIFSIIIILPINIRGRHGIGKRIVEQDFFVKQIMLPFRNYWTEICSYNNC